jgi:predicted nicotinamide N-methyase
MNDDVDEEIYPIFASPLPTNYVFTLYGIKHSVKLCTREKKSSHCCCETAISDEKLFVDDVWPASYLLSDYLVDNYSLYCKDKKVIELGAGAALPSCVADKLGAKLVVITDYPADGVIENIQHMISSNNLTSSIARGYVWGDDAADIVSLSKTNTDDQGSYDTILLADILWKDTYPQHRNILRSIKYLLSRSIGSTALVAFTYRSTIEHRPENDLEFFTIASHEYELTYDFILSSNKYCDVDGNPIEVFLFSMHHRAMVAS